MHQQTITLQAQSVSTRQTPQRQAKEKAIKKNHDHFTPTVSKTHYSREVLKPSHTPTKATGKLQRFEGRHSQPRGYQDQGKISAEISRLNSNSHEQIVGSEVKKEKEETKVKREVQEKVVTNKSPSTSRTRTKPVTKPDETFNFDIYPQLQQATRSKSPTTPVQQIKNDSQSEVHFQESISQIRRKSPSPKKSKNQSNIRTPKKVNEVKLKHEQEHQEISELVSVQNHLEAIQIGNTPKKRQQKTVRSKNGKALFQAAESSHFSMPANFQSNFQSSLKNKVLPNLHLQHDSHSHYQTPTNLTRNVARKRCFNDIQQQKNLKQDFDQAGSDDTFRCETNNQIFTQDSQLFHNNDVKNELKQNQYVVSPQAQNQDANCNNKVLFNSQKTQNFDENYEIIQNVDQDRKPREVEVAKIRQIYYSNKEKCVKAKVLVKNSPQQNVDDWRFETPQFQNNKRVKKTECTDDQKFLKKANMKIDDLKNQSAQIFIDLFKELTKAQYPDFPNLN
eukprot:403366103